MLWTIPHWGSLFIKRYDFKPLYLLGAVPLIWRRADLGRFWATYERWMAKRNPAAYRPSVIAANPNKQTRPISADDFASRWDALADELARLAQTTVQACSS